MEAVHTERLLLRSWRGSDAAPFYALNPDPRTHQLLPGSMRTQQVQSFMRARKAMQRDADGDCDRPALAPGHRLARQCLN